MVGKKWILKDSDGNLPTAEDVEQFLSWLTHETSRPVVGVKQNKSACEFSFTDPGDRPTFSDMEAAAQSAKHQLSELKAFVSAAELAVGAKDWETVRRIFGHKD
jgi:hypothetical protein